MTDPAQACLMVVAAVEDPGRAESDREPPGQTEPVREDGHCCGHPGVGTQWAVLITGIQKLNDLYLPHSQPPW